MIRFAVSFAMVSFVVAIAYAQPQVDKTNMGGCWGNVTRKCQDMAFYGTPQEYWVNCELAVCNLNLFGLLECNYSTGLKVTDANRDYQDVAQVATGVKGKELVGTAVSAFKCGEVTKCHCRLRGMGWSCLFEEAKEKDYKPKEYWTYGSQNCTGL